MHNGLKIAIVVFLLTLLVVVINPKSHKSLTISNSSNMLVTINNTEIENQEFKLSNEDNLKSTKNYKLNNVKSLKNSDTKIKNFDNLKNKNNLVAKNKDSISDEQRLLNEYRRRRALPKEPVVYEYKSKNYDAVDKPLPRIKLDKNFQEELDFAGLTNSEGIKSEPVQQIKEEPLPENVEQKSIQVEQKTAITKSKKQKSKTPYEETIVWNKWKSDLHNIIHNNVAYLIPEDMPLGALYKYSFYVDKHGQISNIDVKILFPGLAFNKKNQIALEDGKKAFKKVITKCAGRKFLKFPKGSQRDYVQLELVVQMGPINVYTNPGDFNDLEKVFGFR